MAVKLDDRVVVDNDGFDIFGKSSIETLFGGAFQAMFPSGSKKNPIIRTDFDVQYAQYDHCDPGVPFGSLQLQTSPSDLHCYSIQNSRWYHISVVHLKPADWSHNALQNVVLKEETKVLLRKLVEYHKTDQKNSASSNFIRIKGQGLVMVLHGPPGVGKTLTAGN